jgi:hypothetical protein
MKLLNVQYFQASPSAWFYVFKHHISVAVKVTNVCKFWMS